jgi:hypothetical protein
LSGARLATSTASMAASNACAPPPRADAIAGRRGDTGARSPRPLQRQLFGHIVVAVLGEYAGALAFTSSTPKRSSVGPIGKPVFDSHAYKK